MEKCLDCGRDAGSCPENCRIAELEAKVAALTAERDTALELAALTANEGAKRADERQAAYRENAILKADVARLREIQKAAHKLVSTLPTSGHTFNGAWEELCTALTAAVTPPEQKGEEKRCTS